MSQQNLAQYVEASLLRPDVTEAQVREFCNDARQHGWAAVCVNPAWVELALNVLGRGAIRVCSVSSFPFGAGVPSAKSTEARLALEAGASEINMVLNIGALKSGEQGQVQREITYVYKAVKNVNSHAIFKVIVECPLLTDAEKTTAGKIVAAAGADFIMTGSGFSGASTAQDVQILKAAVGRLPIVAEGATNAQQLQEFVQAGATRVSIAAPGAWWR